MIADESTDMFAVSVDDGEDPFSIFHAFAQLLDYPVVEVKDLADSVKIRTVAIVRISEWRLRLDPLCLVLVKWFRSFHHILGKGVSQVVGNRIVEVLHFVLIKDLPILALRILELVPALEKLQDSRFHDLINFVS